MTLLLLINSERINHVYVCMMYAIASMEEAQFRYLYIRRIDFRDQDVRTAICHICAGHIFYCRVVLEDMFATVLFYIICCTCFYHST